MTTLYRQYRPSRFAELVGQDHVSHTLMRAVTQNRVAHAYVFYGPRGTGKTSTARILAKRLNCTNPADAEPCNTCEQCQASAQSRHLDVVEIDAASNRGIDDIRALKDGIGLRPSMGKYKIYIIDEVHMLTNEAFTALLKTLEEPTAHAVFILATTELHKVPETILSRCQVYRFRRATTDELRGRLTYLLEQEKRTAENAVLDFIIQRSDGCYRDAESLLGQLLTASDKKIKLSAVTEFLGLPSPALIDDFLLSLIRGQSAPALTALESAFTDGFDPEQLVRESILRARDVALALVQHQEVARAFANETQALSRLPQILRALVQAQQDLAYMPQPMIALQLAILTVCTQKGEVAPPPVTTPIATISVPKITTKEKKPAVKSGETGTTSEKVRGAWPAVIQNMKVANPVASTFLRAMEPISNIASNVTVQARYALHRNFFGKRDNKTALEAALSEVMGEQMTVTIAAAESPVTVGLGSANTPQEQELLAAVKEVFS